MARSTSVTLGGHFETFIAEQLSSGRFGSASEVIRAGLRLLESNEAKMQLLREALIAGEQSGPADYSYQSLIDELDNT